jgi:hypothetical protein
MKSMITNLLLLTMVFTVYSCNEKISAKLEGGSSTTVPPVIVPSQYYFKITNQSATVLNYVLHRTGSGNGTKECSITSNGVAFSNDLYVGESTAPHDTKAFDISCFMEAEELSLQFNGLDFNIEVSPNTCEYISYAPYSYLDNIPGSSSGNYIAFTCDAAAKASGLPTAALATAAGAVDKLGAIPCGYMVDTGVPVVDRVRRVIPTDTQKLCAYDYSQIVDADVESGGQNCDVGIIKSVATNIIYVPAIADDPLTAADETTAHSIVPDPAVVNSTHQCGGKVKACMQGAFKQIPVLANSEINSSIIYSSVLNETFVEKYKLPKLQGMRRYNSDIVNYRRGLASVDLNYVDYSTGNNPNWGDASYNKSFDPNLMERYAANRNPDGTYIIDAWGTSPANINPTVNFATWVSKVQVNGWSSMPYAADPFLGYGTKARVNPFYTFYCLDRAKEIKGKIRMVVRDWDRVFPAGSSNLELISDAYKSLSARRLDMPISEEEVPGDPGYYNTYDDISDWDVRVEMTRTDPNGVGVYDPGFTRWQPTAGWWSSDIFPKEGPYGSGEI